MDKNKSTLSEDVLLDKVSRDTASSDDKPTKEFKKLLDAEQAPPKKKDRRYMHHFKVWFKDLSKKQKILFCSVIAIVLLGGVGAAAWFVTRPDSKPAPTVAKKAEKPADAPAATTEPSRLTGKQIVPELNKRGVTGIMIENSPDARPQSGLTQAGVVFEAIAEGGITRFLALYQEDQPEYIGPVRSVRPYYLDWLQGFDAPIAHAGGSNDALAKIKTDKVKDLDQFANAKAYQRVNSRYAPHNLYTSAAKLDALKESKGFGTSEFTGFVRKAKEEPSKAPTATTLDFEISGFYYNPRYVYDAGTNTYKRSEGGKPHTDEKTGNQIAPKVVIANIMAYSVIDSVGHSGYNTVGSGKSFIFQDGTVTIGSWKKTSSKSQMQFLDANGADIKLNPGQTWISAVGNAAGVKYTL